MQTHHHHQSHPPTSRFGPPARTIYQETVLTAAAIPPPSQPNSYHHSPMPQQHGTPFPMQNPPGSAMSHHPPSQYYSMNHPHAFHPPSRHHHHQGQPGMPYGGSQQQSMASQQYPFHPTGPNMTMTPTHHGDPQPRMGYATPHQPAVTPTMMATTRPNIGSSFRRNTPSFPPRRPRRFVR